MEKSIIHALCLSTRSLGYPKRKELRLEAEVRGILKTRGVRGVVRRMKDLQMTRQYALQGQRRSSWVAMSRKGVMPRRAAERDLWALSDRKFFAITGAVLQSCQKKVDGKDLLDWYSTASEPGVKPSSRLWQDPTTFDEDTRLRRMTDESFLALKRMLSERNVISDEDTRKWLTSNETPLALKPDSIYQYDPAYNKQSPLAATEDCFRSFADHMRSLGYLTLPTRDKSGSRRITWFYPSPEGKFLALSQTNHPYANETASGIVKTQAHMAPLWSHIANDLLDRLSHGRTLPFGPSDMKGTAFPIGRSILRPKTVKKGDTLEVDTDSLLAAFQLSRMSAPKLVDDEDSFVSRFTDVLRMQNAEFGNERGRRANFAYDVNTQPASVAHWYAANEQYSRLDKSKLDGVDTTVVGIISFLAKPGTKVRVVANPNRRVQAVVEPLGLSLQDMVYHNPELQPHIDVEDQDHGRLAVSSALKQGRRLASVDLSSATDTIDFGRSLFLTGYYAWNIQNAESIARGYRLISNSSTAYYAGEMSDEIFLEREPDLLQRYHDTDAYKASEHRSISQILADDSSPIRRGLQEMYSTKQVKRDLANCLLDHSMRMFDRIRTSDWAVDLSLNPQVPDTFQFMKGQPLGTRPSFPLLTMTNVAAAKASGATWFHVVGDDIILDDSHYDRYSTVMTEFLGSKVNDAKTLRSDRIAEFVGYMFDHKGRIYPKKPRITGSKIENALKFGPEQPSVSELIGWSTLSQVPGKATLAEVRQDDSSFISRIASSPSGDSPSVAMRLAARYLQELIEDDAPTTANSFQVNGNLLAAHLETLNKGIENLPAENHASSVKIPTKEQHFDHRTNSYRTEQDSAWRRVKQAAKAGKLAHEVQNSGDGLITHDGTSAVLDVEGNYVIARGDRIVAQGDKLAETLAAYLSTHDHPGVAEYNSHTWSFSPEKGANVKSDTLRRKGQAPKVERIPSDGSVELGPELG